MKHIKGSGFYLIVAVMVAAASILIVTDSLPEKAAAHFNALTDVTIDTNYRVVKEPSPTDNTFIYALNEVAEKSIAIAEKDRRVREIIESGSAGKAVTSQRCSQLSWIIEAMDSLRILDLECS